MKVGTSFWMSFWYVLGMDGLTECCLGRCCFFKIFDFDEWLVSLNKIVELGSGIGLCSIVAGKVFNSDNTKQIYHEYKLKGYGYKIVL